MTDKTLNNETISLPTIRAFAIEKHGAQMYGDKPYVYHLDKVVEKLKVLGYTNEIYLAIGYLHDIVEDTNVTWNELIKLNPVIITAIEALTKREGYVYEEYIAGILKNHWACAVKVADTMCNLEESLLIRNAKWIRKYSKQLHLLLGNTQ